MFCVKGDKFSFPFIQKLYSLSCMPDCETACVVGNIIEVTDKELAQLDVYESVAKGLYVREKVEVYSDNVRSIEVWVYVGGPALAYALIESGDWLAR